MFFISSKNMKMCDILKEFGLWSSQSTTTANVTHVTGLLDQEMITSCTAWSQNYHIISGQLTTSYLDSYLVPSCV